jgi:hypothetical protein
MLVLKPHNVLGKLGAGAKSAGRVIEIVAQRVND